MANFLSPTSARLRRACKRHVGAHATCVISLLSSSWTRTHAQQNRLRAAAGTMGKKDKGEEGDDDEGEKKIRLRSPIANPLAGKKLTKKVLKGIKKAAKAKGIRRGVKEVVKALKKGEKGLCVIAGDISPIDVIAHVPIFCEELNVPYVYVPSKEDLGTASQTKRPTSIVLMSCKADADYKDTYDEAVKEVAEITPRF